MPVEVLQVVFEFVLAPSLLPPSSGRFGERAITLSLTEDHRLHAPFQLAMVCSYWRKVRLAMSCAWAYVGMPVWRRWSHGDLEILKVALARSRTAPLDVVLRRILADRHGLVSEAFDLLLADVHRWKRAEIKVPASRCTAVALGHCFRQSTPFLTLLVITADAPVTVEVESFFPDAPRLATLAVDRVNLSKSGGNASIYPSLTTLKLTNHIFLVILATSLSTCAKTLRDLRLENIHSHLGDLDEHVFPVVLPMLDSLEFMNAIPSLRSDTPLIVAPRLKRLLHSEALQSYARSFINAVAPTVVELALCTHMSSDLSTDAAEFLSALHSVRSLSLGDCPDHRHIMYSAGSVRSGFFNRLATSPMIFSKLEKITVMGTEETRPLTQMTQVERLSTAILAFVRSRTVDLDDMECEAADATARPSRLKNVVVDYDNMPLSLESDIRELLAVGGSAQ